MRQSVTSRSGGAILAPSSAVPGALGLVLGPSVPERPGHDGESSSRAPEVLRGLGHLPVRKCWGTGCPELGGLLGDISSSCLAMGLGTLLGGGLLGLGLHQMNPVSLSRAVILWRLSKDWLCSPRYLFSSWKRFMYLCLLCIHTHICVCEFQLMRSVRQ